MTYNRHITPLPYCTWSGRKIIVAADKIFHLMALLSRCLSTYGFDSAGFGFVRIGPEETGVVDFEALNNSNFWIIMLSWSIVSEFSLAGSGMKKVALVLAVQVPH